MFSCVDSVKKIAIYSCFVTLMLGCATTTQVVNERSLGGLTNKFEMTFEYLSAKQVLEIYARIKNEWPGTIKTGEIRGAEPVISFSLVTKNSQAGIISALMDLLQDFGISEKDINIRAKSNRINVEYLGETVHLSGPLRGDAVVVEFPTLSEAFRPGGHHVFRGMSQHELVSIS